MSTPRHPRGPAAAARGFLLVELMVGLALGLFVAAAAGFALSVQLADTRRLLLDAQVEQDLRSSADLIARDVRRSGYWQDARAPLLPASAGAINAYAPVQAGDTADGSALSYAYSQDAHADDGLVDGDDQAGLALQGGTVKLHTGGGWQPLTDPGVVTVTQLQAHVDVQALPLSGYCANPCPAVPTAVPCPPVLQIREIQIDLAGHATLDAAVVRSLHVAVRLPNDQVVGRCA